MAQLTATHLALLYGEVEIFSEIALQVNERDRIGIVGPNGGGKTSLVRVLVGELDANVGSVSRSAGLRMGYVPQVADGSMGGSVRDYIMSAFDGLRHLEDELASSALEIQQTEGRKQRDAERRYSSILLEYETLGGYDYQNRMERVVAGIELSSEVLDNPVSVASGGERTRAALARALLTDPDLLVLDEPTNYLDFKGLAWLESFLNSFAHSYIVVSHDRYFLDRTVNQVWELDRGRLKSYRGNYSKFRELKEEQAIRQQKEFERQQEFIAKEEWFIERYHAGQRTKEARGRATRLARLERIDAVGQDQSIHIGGLAADRTGQIALSTHGLKVGFIEGDKRTQLLSVPDLTLERGSRTAVVGGNGTGKTTLIRTLLDLISPLSGKVELGYHVEVGYHRQGSDDLPAGSTVLEAMLDMGKMLIAESRNYLARFLFQGEDVFKPVSALSGGERTRLALARLLVTEPNVLFLDEPTTHLDIPSREALEQALLSYNGALLFVSHDRHLISLLAHQLWIVDKGVVQHFPGTFEEWIQGEQPDTPPQSKRSKARARRRKAIQRENEKPEPERSKIDYEQVISEFEKKLVEIESALNKASEGQNLDEITSLGEEYNSIQAELEEAYEAWGG